MSVLRTKNAAMLNDCFVLCLLLMFVNVLHSLTNTMHCFPQYDGASQCYIRPTELLSLSWEEAQQWCKNNGATLPILKNNIYYDDSNVIRSQYAYALRVFGLADQLVWLAIKSAQDPNNWTWIDGSTFSGTIETGGNVNNTYAYMIRSGANISFGAAPPFEENLAVYRPYDCDGIHCSYTPTCLRKNGRCYNKGSYRDAWYRSNSEYLIVIPDSGLGDIGDWLDESTKYWIGLRCHSWYWQDAVTNEATEVRPREISFSEINATYEQCLASRNRVYAFNKHCRTRLPFICQTPKNTTRTTESWNSPTTSRTMPTSSSSINIIRTTTTQHPTSRTKAESKARDMLTTSGNTASSTVTIPRTTTTQCTPSETTSESTTNTGETIALRSTADGKNVFRTSATTTHGITASASKLDLLIGLGGCLLLLIIIWLIILTALYIRLYRRYKTGLHGHWGNFKEHSVKFIHGKDKFPYETGASNDAIEFQDSSECSKSNDTDCMNKPILHQS